MPSAESGMREVLDHRPAGERIGLRQGRLDLRVERALADRDRRRRALGDLAGQRLRYGERIALGDDAVDEPEPLRLRRAVEGAGQRHFHRMLPRNRAPDRDQRRRTEETDSDAGQRETRFRSGDREIASGGQLAPGGRRDPLDRRDHRLWQRDDRLHQIAAALHQRRVVLRAPVGIVAMRPDLPQVVPRRKRRTFAGEDDDPDRRVGGDRLERADQRLDHAEAQRVARGRRVERQRRDAGLVVAADEGRGRGFHGSVPLGSERQVVAAGEDVKGGGAAGRRISDGPCAEPRSRASSPSFLQGLPKKCGSDAKLFQGISWRFCGISTGYNRSKPKVFLSKYFGSRVETLTSAGRQGRSPARKHTSTTCVSQRENSKKSIHRPWMRLQTTARKKCPVATASLEPA